MIELAPLMHVAVTLETAAYRPAAVELDIFEIK